MDSENLVRYAWPFEKPRVRLEERNVRHPRAVYKDGEVTIICPAGIPPGVHKKTKSVLVQKLANKVNNIQLRHIVSVINSLHFNNRVPVKFVRFSSRMTRSLGSYSSKGVLKVSVRMMKAPKFAFDYVIIHELAHGIEFNHSKKFWEIVQSACPNYKQIRDWLKYNL